MRERTALRIGNITVAERIFWGRSNNMCYKNHAGNASFSYNRCVAAIGKYSFRSNKPTPHRRKCFGWF